MIPGIPYDAEVEYLESHGTEWIDTELDYFADFEIDIQLRSNAPNVAFSAGTGRMERINEANPYWNISNGIGNSFQTRTPITERHTVAWRGGVVSVDGVATDSFVNIFATGDLILFGTASNHYANVIYSCRFFDPDGVLVRDFIPVRVGTVGYLYDRVTKKLFHNQGTGSFVVGPDVAKPVIGLHFMKPGYTAKDYVQDGLVAMWDGIENAGWGQHDPNATVWKDLIGELDLTFSLDCVIEQDGVLFGSSKGVAIVLDKNISPYDVEFVLQRTETSRAFSVFWYDSSDYDMGSAGSTYAIGFKNLSFGQAGGYFLSPGNGGELFAIHYHKYPVPKTAYVNGSSATSSSANEQWTPFGKAVCIGGRAPGSANNFVGRIKSVRAYSRALTADEIATNYAVDKARFNIPEVA